MNPFLILNLTLVLGRFDRNSLQSESLMSTILIASVSASTSSKAGGADQGEELSGVEEMESVEREDLAKSQLGDGQGVTLLVPPWHAAARHASLCAVDLSVGVTVMD